MGSPGLAIRRPHYTPAAPPQAPHCVRGDIQQGEWALFRSLLDREMRNESSYLQPGALNPGAAKRTGPSQS